MSDYQTQLDAWKAKHGIGRAENSAEGWMLAQEMESERKDRCITCAKEMPIMKMELITRSIDPCVQLSKGFGDYIPVADRVRMCPECFAAKYPKQP